MPHTRVPVAVAQQIGDAHKKDIVLLVTWDAINNTTNVVTWGREPSQKQAAASAGETIQKALGLMSAGDVHEDYRREGEAAKEVDRLRRILSELRSALQSIVVDRGEDAGLILLSNDSPTTWDDNRQCQVYDNVYFSPLGEALVAASRLAAQVDPGLASPDG